MRASSAALRASITVPSKPRLGLTAWKLVGKSSSSAGQASNPPSVAWGAKRHRLSALGAIVSYSGAALGVAGAPVGKLAISCWRFEAAGPQKFRYHTFVAAGVVAA